MTLNLDRLEQAARAATPDWPHRTSKADAAYIAAVSPANILPLIEALKEWRDAYGAWASAESVTRLGLAADTLFALIGDDT